jgi:hypothetical protein
MNGNSVRLNYAILYQNRPFGKNTLLRDKRLPTDASSISPDLVLW